MSKATHVIILCMLVAVGCARTSTEQTASQKSGFHTRPDKWDCVRMYHRPIDKKYIDRITVSKIDLQESLPDKKTSPNGAYWFAASNNSGTEDEYDLKDLQVDIYNERDYLLRLCVADVYVHFKTDIEWINEKLLFVRVWWGRVMGVDIVFDVELEQMIFCEMVQDGKIEFWQWQQHKCEAQNDRRVIR